MEKVQFYMWFDTASIESTPGNKTKFSPSPFHTSTTSRLTLVESVRERPRSRL